MEKSIKATKPFFMVNPKSYLYGEALLDLALEADCLAKNKDIQIYFTAPYADIHLIASHTKNIIVTAQHMDGLDPGRGMGAVLGESLYEAGARASFLNHAECPLTLHQLVKSIQKARALGMISIVCADSLEEARAIAILHPDILLCEETGQIGTGQVSPMAYVQETINAIRSIDPNILIMQAAGIKSPEDVRYVMDLGADGTGCTSGIVKAENPKAMLRAMLDSLR